MDFLSFQSVPAILKENARMYARRPAISSKAHGVFITFTYAEFYERVLKLARGLEKVGMQPGDRVAILSENRLGWAISDFGIQSARGITVPIYATNTADQVAYVVNHSGARIVFVSTKGQYEKLLTVREKLPEVELVISYERFMGERSFPVYTQYQLSEASTPISEEEKRRIEAGISRIGLDDTLTVIYTSGTTGTPKGVVLTHRNIITNVHYSIERAGELGEHETFLSFLPLSHVLERTGSYYVALLSGNHIAFAEDLNKVVENMSEIRPTTMVSVPRFFEKIHSRIFESVYRMNPLRKYIFHAAIRAGRSYIHKKFITKEPLGLLGVKYKIFDYLVFAKIRARFGGRLRRFVCGGAPLDKSINEFMWMIGVPIFNGYGLTETSPVVTLCNRAHVRFDSVGKALAETEIMCAEDGELCVKGPQVMPGYYKNEQATAEAFEGGWFKTGDIAVIDEQGFVVIVDRKKEIIVTAGGKNIAPQPIENELRLDKYISNAMVFGDRKPYLVAVLTPNMERLIELARKENLHYLDMYELATSTRIKALYAERIEALNKNLPPYSTIKNFAIVPGDFTVEGGELTPTLKLKRARIYDRYKELIDELYVDREKDVTHRGKASNGEKI